MRWDRDELEPYALILFLVLFGAGLGLGAAALLFMSKLLAWCAAGCTLGVVALAACFNRED